jgi:hypothetical protein
MYKSSELIKNITSVLLSTAGMLAFCSAAAQGQRPRFGDFFQSQSTSGPQTIPARTLIGLPNSGQQLPSFGTVNSPQFGQPGFQQNLPQNLPQNANQPIFQNNPPIITATPPPQLINPGQSQPAQIMSPSFDPFNSGSNPYPFVGQPSQLGLNPEVSGNTYVWPNNQLPDNGILPGNYQAQPWQPNWTQPNQSILGSSPNSSGWPNSPPAWPSIAWSKWRVDYMPRFMQHLRFRQSWLSGGDGADVDILDSEIATSLTFGNFFGSPMPLRLTPSFIFHFWNGPETAMTGFDLPAQAYSASLAADFTSDTRRSIGIETNVGVGVYTDFYNVNSDSLRVTGVGLGWVKVNRYTTMKIGVEYLDRIDVKLLPAFGFFMQPNNELKLDLYFPRPKVAHRMPRLGNFDVWAYTGGEYGGGSWTIERMGGMDDQVDINDVRAFMGLEWMGPRGVTGFLEGGYVFDRQMLYRSDPATKLDLSDTIMLRMGIAF